MPKSNRYARTRDPGASPERSGGHAAGMNGAPVLAFAYRPCRWCRYFGAAIPNNNSAWCNDPRAPHVHSGAEYGCSFWEREPGADDDAGDCAMPYGAVLA